MVSKRNIVSIGRILKNTLKEEEFINQLQQFLKASFFVRIIRFL